MTTLTPHTKIQVGLAVTLVASAGALYLQVYNLGGALRNEIGGLADRVEGRYISKELFQAEMGSLRRETDQNVARLSEKLTELKNDLAAIKANAGNGR